MIRYIPLIISACCCQTQEADTQSALWTKQRWTVQACSCDLHIHQAVKWYCVIMQYDIALQNYSIIFSSKPLSRVKHELIIIQQASCFHEGSCCRSVPGPSIWRYSWCSTNSLNQFFPFQMKAQGQQTGEKGQEICKRVQWIPGPNDVIEVLRVCTPLTLKILTQTSSKYVHSYNIVSMPVFYNSLKDGLVYEWDKSVFCFFCLLCFSKSMRHSGKNQWISPTRTCCFLHLWKVQQF